MTTSAAGEALRREAFALPDGLVYLDGNSLGPLPVAARERLATTLDAEWGEMLIRGWNDAGWFDLPETLGERIGRLIGAPPGSVVAGDSTSINLFKALNAALDLAPRRGLILSDTGNFPTDLYIAQGVARSRAGVRLRTVEPEAVAAALDEQVAVLMLTEIDYRSARRHDMSALTAAAHACGALTVWDLAHSAGALPVDLAGADADFAVGCGYKYLNGGPGAPAFVYAHPRHADRIGPHLSGWLGHAAPFDFEAQYRPAAGVRRLRVGTPPILAMRALDAALDAWDGIDLDEVRERSLALSNAFIEQVEAQCAGFDVALASPREAARRGSHVTFRHPHGYAVIQALIAHRVIGDFRAPDLMRFGFAPLYNCAADVDTAASVLAAILREGSWDRPEFHARAAVT